MLYRLISTITLSVAIAVSLAAQTAPPASQSTKDAEKAREELENRALKLLDGVVLGAQSLKLPENRAIIRSQAADLLWKRDEKRARALFREAVGDLAAALRAEETSRRNHSYWMLMQLRPQLLQMVAARDPQFAIELLRESRQPAEEGAETEAGMGDQELRLEQSFAAQAAEADPKGALRMAEEGLEKGVTYGAVSVLERLRVKDSEAATRLAGKIVERLGRESLRPEREATSVALYLLRAALLPESEQQQLAPGWPPSRAAEKRKPLVIEEPAVRQLAEWVSVAALKDSPATGAFGLTMQLRPLLPELEKRVPARVAQLRLKVAEIDKALDPRTKAWMQFESVMRGSPESILEAVEKVPAEMRQSFYSAAAMQLVHSGEAERARQLVNDKLRGEEREHMNALIDKLTVWRAVQGGKLEEAKGVISRIHSKERRAGGLAQLAAAFAARGDRKTAGQLLEEARALIDRQPDNEREVEALLEVARGYALVEPAQTFELLGPLIEQANDMLTAAALLEKFGGGGGLFRKGEMIMLHGLAGMGGAFARYVKALKEVARLDFDRTVLTADRFGRDEVRLSARLMIAQSVLSDRLDAEVPPFGFGMMSPGGGLAVDFYVEN